jgi:hypothetical protein
MSAEGDLSGGPDHAEVASLVHSILGHEFVEEGVGGLRFKWAALLDGPRGELGAMDDGRV